MTTGARAREVIDRLHRAMNEHDVEAFVACFDAGYRSEQPLHPGREFGGREQVRENWSAIFAGVPDFSADLLRTAVEGETVWTEWDWRGTRRDGSALRMGGVIVMGIPEDRIVWARLYVDEVESEEEAIADAVDRMAGPGE